MSNKPVRIDELPGNGRGWKQVAAGLASMTVGTVLVIGTLLVINSLSKAPEQQAASSEASFAVQKQEPPPPPPEWPLSWL